MPYWVLRVRYSKRARASSSTALVANANETMPTAAASDRPTLQISARDVVKFLASLPRLAIVPYFSGGGERPPRGRPLASHRRNLHHSSILLKTAAVPSRADKCGAARGLQFASGAPWK